MGVEDKLSEEDHESNVEDEELSDMWKEKYRIMSFLPFIFTFLINFFMLVETWNSSFFYMVVVA